jgi:uncharacterized membrane-anchored protein YitT (DUF2179 family)
MPEIASSHRIPPRHSALEDAHALLLGSSFAAFGLILLKSAGLVTGALAGVALILSYLTHLPVGILFFVLNLPFLVLAQRWLGWPFALKSLATMAALAVFAAGMPSWLAVTHVHPAFAAIFGGTLIGMGALSLTRHRASAGGLGILATWLHERRGTNVGLFQLTCDLAIMAGSLLVVDHSQFAWSALSVLTLNLVMIAYHRPGRYLGQ